jgi:hypothetical protein
MDEKELELRLMNYRAYLRSNAVTLRINGIMTEQEYERILKRIDKI